MPSSPTRVTSPRRSQRKRRRRIHRHSSPKVDRFGFLKGNSVRRQKKSKTSTARTLFS